MIGSRMATRIDLQNPAGFNDLPSENHFRQWVEAALREDGDDVEQTVRVVDVGESRAMNERYRGKRGPTNVLSFPSEDELLGYRCLGDLVICGPLVVDEARAQDLPVEAHWAHLVVHGMLHLQGYDHQSDGEAAVMEALEVEILGTLGYANPYNERDLSRQ